MDNVLPIVLDPEKEKFQASFSELQPLPIELCSGEASRFLVLSKFGIVCLSTRLDGDLKNAFSHRLLAWLLARADSETVWNSVLPLYRNFELRPQRGNFLPGIFGLCNRKNEWCSTADFHRFLQERYDDRLNPKNNKGNDIF